jgi:plasmid stability protein
MGTAVARQPRRPDVPDILIRGLDADTIERLKAQAIRHGRSMQAEAKTLIESGVKPTLAEWLARVDTTRERLRTDGGVLEGSSAGLARGERERHNGLAGER